MLLVTVLSACTRAPTYTLEASIGTYLQQTEAGSSNTRLGTVLVLKLREDGEPPKTSLGFKLTGPTGFTPLEETYPAGSEWIVVPLLKVTPLAGTYQVEIASGLTQTLELKDVSQTLPLANITATLENSTVNVSWESVVDAVGYYVKLFNTNGGSRVGAIQYTLSAQVQFANAPKSNYAVGVFATNFDTVSDNPTLPVQIMMSDSISPVVQGNLLKGEPNSAPAQALPVSKRIF
jgi:hypothetical protein